MKLKYLQGITKRLAVYLFLFIAVVLVISANLRHAEAVVSAAHVTLTPNSTSVQQGAGVQVTVAVSTAGQVSAALLRVNYDASKLVLQNADYSGLPLDQDFGSANSTGRYTVDRYKLGGPYPVGDIVIAKLNFVASNAGTASVSVDIAGSSISSGDPADNGADHSPLTAGNASIVITAPALPAAPSPPTTSSSAPINSSTPMPTVPTSTSSPSSAPVQTSQTIAQSTIVDEPVVAEPETGSRGTGLVVEIRVIDKEGKIRTDTPVTLDGKTEKTDQQGIASFLVSKAGEYYVEVEGTTKTIMVLQVPSTDIQRFDIGPKISSTLVRLLFMYGVPIIALVLVLVIALFIQRKGKFFPKKHVVITSTPIDERNFMEQAKTSAIEIVAPPDIHVAQPEEVIQPTAKKPSGTE